MNKPNWMRCEREKATCKNCGYILIISNDYEVPMWEHTETGSIYCWDESEVVGEPEEQE